MARLTLAALQRVARAAAASPTAGAERLLLELKKAGDRVAAEHLAGRERALQAGAAPSAGFQVNIRQPLASLAPRQAAGYLARLAPAVVVLAERAVGVEAAEADRIARILDGAARKLRPSG